jgi:hypothetical protein
VIVTRMISPSEAFSNAFILPHHPPCIIHYRQLISPEQGHKRRGKRKQTLVESFQGRFTTQRVADEYDDKVDDVIASEAAASEAHAFLNER